jgi:hypothetical protein
MDAGFDKLILTSKDFIIKDFSIFGQNRNISQGKNETDLPVLSIDNGTTQMENIRANSIFFNHALFNLTINRNGLQVIFNPSKILHPYEINTDFKELKKVSDRINNVMVQNKILTNFDNCIVSRIDLAKQQIIPNGLYQYKPAFEFMCGRSMKSVGYDGGYRWGNKSHEITIYDKSIESKLPFNNLDRCEAKWKNTKTVQKRTGFNNYGILFQSDNNHINSLYNGYLDSTIFRNNIPNQMVLDFSSEVEKMKHFKNSGRNAVLKYLVSSNLNDLINKFGSIETIFDIMKEAGFDKSSISRERKNLVDILDYSGNTSEVNVRTLIQDLKYKFAS